MISSPPETLTAERLKAKTVQPAAGPQTLPPSSPSFWAKYGPWIALVAVLVLAGVSHGVNMQNFPYIENDEGIYTSQAWSVMTGQGLANYTYWYDHPPVGWMQLGAWLALTGGPFTFGISTASGRILMLLLHIGASFFLFKIGHKISGSIYVGAAAVVFFSLSPLGIYFQRRILLDNFMTFWVLATVYLILCRYKKGLTPIILSAVAFGIAIMSKEVGIVFMPALLYMLWTRLDPRHRILALLSWLTIVATFVAQWFAYATLKGELFPTGTLFGGTNDHVSLLATLSAQAARGSGKGLFSPDNDFWTNFTLHWMTRDPILMLVGGGATLLNLALGFKYRLFWYAAFPTLCMIIFLGRGGLVIEYYILPAIPFLALNIALLTWGLFKVFQRAFLSGKIILPVRLAFGMAGLGVIALAVVAALPVYYTSEMARNDYFADQTSQQVEAIKWVEANLPKDAFIAGDHYGLIDLQTAGFKNYQSSWKVAEDPDINVKILHQDWTNIQYIFTTWQVSDDIDRVQLPYMTQARDHSNVIKTFKGKDGWDIDIRKVDDVVITNLNVLHDPASADGTTPVEIQASLKAIKLPLNNVNLLMEVHDSAGKTVGKTVISGKSLAAGSSDKYSFKVNLPAGLDASKATVVLAVFDADWQNPFVWQEFKNLL